MYKEKYLKYKNKYISLKKQLGGALDHLPFPVLDYNCKICYGDINEEIGNSNVVRCENYHIFHKYKMDELNFYKFHNYH